MMQRISVVKIISGVLTILLTITFLLMVFTGISEILDSFPSPSYGLEEEDYLSVLQQEDYTTLYSMTCRDCILDTKKSAAIEACQAVAHYYHAATLYKSYLLNQDSLYLPRQIRQMEQYAAQSGTYSNHIETINQLLELDPIA